VTLPFYKLQLAGNGFILIDLAALPPETAPAPDRYADIARKMCDRRFGVGATGAIFLAKDNTIRIFGAQGSVPAEADDAYLCAARFAFDTGRVAGRKIIFKTNRDDKEIEVLGAHEFRIGVGSPFSMLAGRVIDENSDHLVESIERDGIKVACSALHIHEDVLVAFPQALGAITWSILAGLVQKAFPGRAVLPVIARAITSDTILARTNVKKESGCCAAAAAALVSSVCAGNAEREAVVMFEQGGDTQIDAVIARDRDNSRRVVVSWVTEQNELQVIGSGGYLFEGKFDVPDETARND
jgi:diaminopimelate epimerase